eukprot:3496651-Lingulodinium_polyedra.AAC.1
MRPLALPCALGHRPLALPRALGRQLPHHCRHCSRSVHRCGAASRVPAGVGRLGPAGTRLAAPQR